MTRVHDAFEIILIPFPGELNGPAIIRARARIKRAAVSRYFSNKIYFSSSYVKSENSALVLRIHKMIIPCIHNISTTTTTTTIDRVTKRRNTLAAVDALEQQVYVRRPERVVYAQFSLVKGLV